MGGQAGEQAESADPLALMTSRRTQPWSTRRGSVTSSANRAAAPKPPARAVSGMMIMLGTAGRARRGCPARWPRADQERAQRVRRGQSGLPEPDELDGVDGQRAVGGEATEEAGAQQQAEPVLPRQGRPPGQPLDEQPEQAGADDVDHERGHREPGRRPRAAGVDEDAGHAVADACRRDRRPAGRGRPHTGPGHR